MTTIYWVLFLSHTLHQTLVIQCASIFVIIRVIVIDGGIPCVSEDFTQDNLSSANMLPTYFILALTH